MKDIIIEDLKKLNIVIDQSESYFSRLRQVHKDLLKKGSPDYLPFAYLALCAATLEYSLNWLYFNHNLKSKSPKDFLAMGLKNKLHVAPIRVTNQLYQFNLNHSKMKDLEELIKRRNTMLHNESYAIPIDIENEKDKNGIVEFRVENHIESLDQEECISYGIALGKLKSDLLDQYRNNSINDTDFIIKM